MLWKEQIEHLCGLWHKTPETAIFLIFFVKWRFISIASNLDIWHPVWRPTHDIADGFVIDILTTFDNEFIMDMTADKAVGEVTHSFFDGNALDVARFIFGADCEEVLVHDGWMTIDEEIDVGQAAEEEDFDSENSESAFGGQILEGSRNNTMSRFAGRVLKRYGITEKAYEAFLEHAKKCDPPLPESELKTIWNSAVKFFQKSIVNQEGYVPPDEYNADFESASLKPEDYSDIGQAIRVNPREIIFFGGGL